MSMFFEIGIALTAIGIGLLGFLHSIKLRRQLLAMFGLQTVGRCIQATDSVGAVSPRISGEAYVGHALLAAGVVVLLWAGMRHSAWICLGGAMVGIGMLKSAQQRIPGTVLMLGCSVAPTIMFHSKLRRSLSSLSRVISLLESRDSSTDLRIAGDCFRIDEGLEWQKAVGMMCKHFPLLILDLREGSEFVAWEVSHVCGMGYLPKTIILTDTPCFTTTTERILASCVAHGVEVHPSQLQGSTKASSEDECIEIAASYLSSLLPRPI